MSELNTPEVPANTTSLPRKALIIAGAATGLIVAGGLAFLKNRNAEDVVEAETSES